MNHIKKEEGISWCGESLGGDFYFKDIEHVTINNTHGVRFVCTSCLCKVANSLFATPLTDIAHASILED